MVKVFLVDDYEVVCCGLVDLFGVDFEFDVVGEVGLVVEVMVRVFVVCLDVVVLDVWLFDGNGIELCCDLLFCMFDLCCLIFMFYIFDEVMLDVIFVGVSGYVVKDIKGMELVCVVKDVGVGWLLLDNWVVVVLMVKLCGGVEK